MQVMMLAMRARPDAIVLDINMPGGTGMEALKKLKASVKTAHIPVLVLSGSISPADPVDGDRARRVGVSGEAREPGTGLRDRRPAGGWAAGVGLSAPFLVRANYGSNSLLIEKHTRKEQLT